MSATQSAYNANDWQHYWENWLQTQQEFIRQMQGAQGMQSQWDTLFKEWKTNLNSTVPGASAYQQFFTQAGQQFLDMMKQFSQGAGDNKNPADIAGEWMKHMQSFFSGLQQKSASPFDPMESWKTFSEAVMKAMPAFAGGAPMGFGPASFSQMFGIPGWNSPAWSPMGMAAGMNGMGGGANGFGAGWAQQPFAANMWQQFGNPQNWQMPGWATHDWQKNFDFGAKGIEAFDPFGFCASIPGIGYTREKQEALNHLYKLWVEFENQSGKYTAAMAQVGMDATARFQEYINNPPADAPPLHSLKEVYAKWVDVCEDVYAKYALSDDYTRVYGEVVNALMSFRKQLNNMTDSMVEQMNLPTRKEVDSLHKRMHELRRDNIQLKKDVAELQKKLGVKKPAQAKPAAATTPEKPAKPAPAAKKSAKKGK